MVLGYFRSDVREGIALYDEDLVLIREFFADESNVFLVIRNAESAQPAAGFFFWEGDTIFSTFSFMEFGFHESLLASGPAISSPPTRNDAGHESATAVQVLAPENTIALDPPSVDESRTEPAQNPPSTRRWLIAAGIVFILGVALGAYVLVFRRTGSSPGVPLPVLARTNAVLPSLGLAVSPSGSEISILWNGQAAVVRSARVGMLTIEDGNARHDLPLKPVDLRSSRVLYTPKNSTVRIALEIFAHDGKVTRENVISVSQAGSSAPAPTDTRSDRVGVAVDRNPAPPERPGETQVKKPSVFREFIPPVREQRTVFSTLAESPPTIAPRIDVTRVDSPGAPVAAPNSPIVAPKSPVVSQNVANVAPNNAAIPLPKPPPNTAAVKPSQPAPAVPEPVVQPPVPIRQARPVLPANVKAMLPGRVAVKVRVQVDATGKVASAEPLNATGSLGRFLGAAATSALRTWAFEPAKREGQNVPGELTVEFIFVP